MKKVLILSLVGLLTILGITLGTSALPTATPDSNSVVKALAPEPVGAAIMTDVTHASDDAGYNADIHVVCTNGNHRWLAPGERTALGSSSSSCGMGGVERIVVGYNQTVYCKNYLPPYQNRYFYTGNYNEVPSYASLKCYMQRPL